MVKKLQRKIVVILSLVLWLMLLFALMLINGYNYRSTEKEYLGMRSEVERIVRRLSKANVLEENIENVKEELRGYNNIYGVLIDRKGEIQYFAYSKKKYDRVETAVKQIWQEEKERYGAGVNYSNSKPEKLDANHRMGKTSFGRVEGYRYKMRGAGNGVYITYFEEEALWKEMKPVIAISIVIALCGAAVIILLSILIAVTITKPVEESYNRQKRFIADASHELKTPLAVLCVNLDMLKQGKNPQKYIDYMEQESTKMNQLIQELLMLASVEEEEELFEMEPMDLSDVVEGAVCPFEAIAFEKGISLETRIEEGLLYRGTRTRMERLVGILIDNAMKHAEYEKQIMVELKKEKKHVILSVQNTGKPIPKEEQKKIFERFYRADKSRGRKEGRFGLGLSIAKAITEQHNGTIHVESEGKITKFTVRLKV